MINQDYIQVDDWHHIIKTEGGESKGGQGRRMTTRGGEEARERRI